MAEEKALLMVTELEKIRDSIALNPGWKNL